MKHLDLKDAKEINLDKDSEKVKIERKTFINNHKSRILKKEGEQTH